MDVDAVVEITKVVIHMVVTLLEIKSAVAKLIFFELVTKVLNFFNMLVERSV